MSAPEHPRCPVCRARMTGAPACGRCQADLAPLLTLMAEGHGLRRAARAALREGDFGRAHQRAREAQRRHATAPGARLVALTSLLDAHACAGDWLGA